MLETGRHVGNYEVLARIGEGGVAIVYRVRHSVLETEHALKVLKAERLASEQARGRFLAEARIQAQLRHPNIVAVTDIVSEPGIAGLVMELVSGRSLADEIDGRRCPASAAEARELFLPILDALGFAHARGVVHRDLKPENILLDRTHDGRVVPKVTDFGIAKLMGELAATAGRHSTVADTTLGTHGYMSPEQIRSGKDVDHRTDIFALGTTLLEYLTTRQPFLRDSDFDTMQAVVLGDYRIPPELASSDPAIARTINKALEVERDARFQTCADMAAALAEHVEADRVSERPEAGPAPTAPARPASTRPRAASSTPATPRPAPPATSPPGPQLAIFRSQDGADGSPLPSFDREQEAVARSLGDGHRVIRGVAGSGKTLILIHRARLLAKNFPQHRILVTCYTRTLAGELRSLLGGFPNLHVKHLDSVMAEVLRAARWAHPGYGDGGDAVTARALEALMAGHGPRYDAVLVDEAQDFSTTALQVAVNLLRKNRSDLVIVADAAQNIFRRNFRWKDAGIQAQGRTRILRVNYRNTREIVCFANAFLLGATNGPAADPADPDDETVVIPAESARRSGPLPHIAIAPRADDEVTEAARLAYQWDEQFGATKSVAVLYPSAYGGSRPRDRHLYDELTRLGLDVFWLNDPNNKAARDGLSGSQARVVLCTIHSAKGLEFPNVVLCGFGADKPSDLESLRKLIYVGMTRATERLAVTARRTHPLTPLLETALTSAEHAAT